MIINEGQGWDRPIKRPRLLASATSSSSLGQQRGASLSVHRGEEEESCRRSRLNVYDGVSNSPTGASTVSVSAASSPFPWSEPNTHNTFATSYSSSAPSCAAEEDWLICMGVLPDLTVRMLETTDSHGLNDSSVRLRERDGKLWIYATAQDEPIGWLEARNSLILSSLKECGGVELECELSPSSGTSSAGQGSSKRTASPRKMRASAPVLSVTVYGPVKCAEQVGDYLTSCNEYLQVPLHAQRNTRYFNPQSLSVELDKAPLTSDLRIHSYFGECLDDLGAMDPSAQLEAIGDYEETAAPCSVKTPLFVHQKQALSFLLGRENGWNFSSSARDIWQLQRNSDTGYNNFVNRVTGELSEIEPPLFRGGILADSMGLGKSLSIIALIATAKPRTKQMSPVNAGGGTLIIVPLSLLQTWQDQLTEHLYPGALTWLVYHPSRGRLPSLDDLQRHDVVITTYNVVSNQWRNASRGAKPLHSVGWRRLVLDEAHEIHSPRTLKFRAVANIKSCIRWAITGTPIQNSLNDFASLLRFTGAFFDLELSRLKSICQHLASDPDVREALTCLCLRRSKKVTTLPPRKNTLGVIKFERHEALEYQAANRSIVGLLLDTRHHKTARSHPDVLVKINSLRQICNLGLDYQMSKVRAATANPTNDIRLNVLLDEVSSTGAALCVECGNSATNLFQEDGYVSSEAGPVLISSCGTLVCDSCTSAFAPNKSFACNCSSTAPCVYSPVLASGLDREETGAAGKVSTKVKALVQNLSSIPRTDKALVFSFWTSTLKMIERALVANGIKSTRLDGSRPLKQRQASMDAINSDPSVRVLLMSLRCGSNGLNLTVANHVYLMEPQWNPMLEEQALSRVHRIGQHKPVYIVRFLVEGTIEENIRKLQEKKTDLIEQVFTKHKRGNKWVEQVEALIHERVGT